MFVSSKYSHLALRLGLAAVFLWFGADKFRQPDYWLSAWLPPAVLSVIDYFKLPAIRLVYMLGIFELLVGLSLILGIFTKIFSALAILFLIAIIVTNGLGGITVKDIGLIGGLLAIFFWPVNRHHH